MLFFMPQSNAMILGCRPCPYTLICLQVTWATMCVAALLSSRAGSGDGSSDSEDSDVAEVAGDSRGVGEERLSRPGQGRCGPT